MYRQFLKTNLDTTSLKNRNRYAPKGLKYCNGICQEFRPTSDFCMNAENTSGKYLCSQCRNLIILAEKQVKSGKITVEEFKENSNIVNGEEILVTTTRTCTVCKEEKTTNNFEKTRTQCKECRHIQSIKRNDDTDKYISDIEKLKNNTEKLQNFLVQIPKDKLIKIISHFGAGRKSSDTKDRMVHNLTEHFKKLQNPLLCSGGCGFILQEEFSSCQDCLRKKEKKKDGNHVQKMVDFENNIDEFVDDLTPIKQEDYYLYNKKQILMIATKFGIVHGILKKCELIDKINEKLEERQKNRSEEKIKLLTENIVDEEKKTEIELNGFVVLSREDGYINATQLCKAGKKKFNDWYRIDTTKEIIQALQSDTHIPVSQLVDVKKGNSSKFTQGSWIHPDLAVQLAQWISPTFAIRVSRWVRELSITGTVSIGREASSDRLIQLQQELVRQREINTSLEKKHNNLLKRKSYHKFRTGPCMYIFQDLHSSVLKCKIGIDTEDVNIRFQAHRTDIVALKAEFIVYLPQDCCRLVEQVILKRYESQRRTYQNHEWIFEMEPSHIIESVKTFLNFSGMEYTFETDENLEEYNKMDESDV